MMPVELTFQTESQHLRVKACGDWETDSAKDALESIRERALEDQLTRILIDCGELAPPDTEMVRYFTGEAIAKVLRRPYKTVAILPADMINKFAENVAVNRGANFFVTDDYAAGLKWLLS